MSMPIPAQHKAASGFEALQKVKSIYINSPTVRRRPMTANLIAVSVDHSLM